MIIKSLAFCCLLFTIFIANAQQSFFYKVALAQKSKQKANTIFVSYEIAGVKFTDSINIQKGQYTLYKKIPQPIPATIYSDNESIAPGSVFLANSVLQVNITDSTIILNKTKLQEDFLSLTENDRVRPVYFPLYAQLNQNNDTAALTKLSIIFDSLRNDDIQKSYRYFRANKSSVLSLFAFSRFSAFFSDYAKVEDDYNLLPQWAKKSPDGKNIAAKIRGAKYARVGTPAKAFSQTTNAGQIISLENFKGKYVLLDFWASWCGPCRKEHPNLIKAYQAFNANNFEIISVSLDNNNDAWLNAIKKDNISWTQISDLKGQQNAIALAYGVQSIPANFLINPEGIIIEKDLKGTQLLNTLENILEGKQK